MSAPSWPLCTLYSEVLQGRQGGALVLPLAEVETKAQRGNSSTVTRTETGGHRSTESTAVLSPQPNPAKVTLGTGWGEATRAPVPRTLADQADVIWYCLLSSTQSL